jgi:xanthine dehydrogenase accessory factor
LLIDAHPAGELAAFQELERSRDARIPGALVSWITQDGGRIEVKRRWISSEDAIPPESDPAGRLRLEISKCLESRLPRLSSQPGEPGDRQSVRTLRFVEPMFPLPRLVIAGAGHIGAAVSHLGSRLEFEVTVIDDRSEFANRENLPDADHIIVGDISQALSDQQVGPDTYVVIVTRGHEHDAEALLACIDSEAAYVGMIGSRNKVELMRSQFIEKNWATPEQWGRVRTPIGLEIRSQSVEEIAVSIAAQLVLERSRAARSSSKP